MGRAVRSKRQRRQSRTWCTRNPWTGARESFSVCVGDAALRAWETDRVRLVSAGYPDRPPEFGRPGLRGWNNETPGEPLRHPPGDGTAVSPHLWIDPSARSLGSWRSGDDRYGATIHVGRRDTGAIVLHLAIQEGGRGTHRVFRAADQADARGFIDEIGRKLLPALGLPPFTWSSADALLAELGDRAWPPPTHRIGTPVSRVARGGRAPGQPPPTSTTQSPWRNCAMTTTWRIDFRISGARPGRADAIVAALGEAWGETDVYAHVDEADGEATIATWGVDQIVNGASFAECVAELADVVWEANGGFADVEAAGTCLDHLDQAYWRAGPDPAPEDASHTGAPPQPAEPPDTMAPPQPAVAPIGSTAAIVVCRSMGDGDATSYGPFVGATFDAAVSAAKMWLRGQPCRPARRDPFWTSGSALACERLLSGEGGPPGHEIIRLEPA